MASAKAHAPLPSLSLPFDRAAPPEPTTRTATRIVRRVASRPDRGYRARVPAPLGPLVGLSLGALLALLSPSGFDAAPTRAWPRSHLIVLLFAVLVFAPVCVYFAVFAPDWSVAYVVDSRIIPSALDLVLILIDVASVFGGFLVVRRLTGSHALRAAAAFSVGPLALALVLVLVFHARLRIEGTYHRVRGGFGTEPVAGGPLGYALLWMNSVLAAGFAVTLRLLRATSSAR